MENNKESSKSVLGDLKAEMAKPPIAASAQEAMHPAIKRMERTLVLVNQGPFHGYACSWCGCRFPEVVPSNATLGENLLPFEAQREKRFAEHVCSDRPHVTH
jgi:hypothetical protein